MFHYINSEASPCSSQLYLSDPKTHQRTHMRVIDGDPKSPALKPLTIKPPHTGLASFMSEWPEEPIKLIARLLMVQECHFPTD